MCIRDSLYPAWNCLRISYSVRNSAVIDTIMEQRGLIRAQVAEALGVTEMAVYKWETGKGYPSADKLPLLAEALHCTIDALYGQEPPGPQADRCV